LLDTRLFLSLHASCECETRYTRASRSSGNSTHLSLDREANLLLTKMSLQLKDCLH
jgi:hypothetical protein